MELNDVQMEWALRKARYRDMTVKFTVDGLGDFEMKCGPGEVRVETGRDVSEILGGDYFLRDPVAVALQGRLCVRMDILPDPRGFEPTVTWVKT